MYKISFYVASIEGEKFYHPVNPFTKDETFFKVSTVWIWMRSVVFVRSFFREHFSRLHVVPSFVTQSYGEVSTQRVGREQPTLCLID